MKLLNEWGSSVTEDSTDGTEEEIAQHIIYIFNWTEASYTVLVVKCFLQLNQMFRWDWMGGRSVCAGVLLLQDIQSVQCTKHQIKI